MWEEEEVANQMGEETLDGGMMRALSIRFQGDAIMAQDLWICTYKGQTLSFTAL